MFIAGDGEDGMSCSQHLFTDGSCSRPPVRELARAAWAIVGRNPGSGVRVAIGGLVPQPFPQTSQAAELLAYQAAIECLAEQGQLHIDCQNVVD